MKYFRPPALAIGLFLLGSCTIFDAKQSAEAPVMQPKPLVMPISNNWQIIEEAPKLSDEKGRLPFQTEQSVQPAAAKPLAPAENRTIKTPL